MRRATDSLIALQVLTAIVPAILVLAVLLAELHRSPVHAGQPTHAARMLPPFLTRLLHHGVALRQHGHGANADVTSAPPAQEAVDAQ
jgi:hypothetical protein